MSDTNVVETTLVAGENMQPVNTDAELDAVEEIEQDQQSSEVSSNEPSVEIRDGRMYVNGHRVYSRDDVNKIGAKAKEEAQAKFLNDLNVDSFDKVKSVVSQLQGSNSEEASLNVQSLRDAVKKREQTVEELRAELNAVKTNYALREHIGALKDNMPASWNADQKSAVVDLMNARNMLQLDGERFVIRNGEDFLTTDGESPDYAGAVTMVGKSLGLPLTKKGIDTTFNATDKVVENSSAEKPLDTNKLANDAAYRNAYVSLRNKNKSLSHAEVTDAMIKKQMDSVVRASTGDKMLTNSGLTSTKNIKSRR